MLRVYNTLEHGYVGTMTGGRYRRIVPADRAYHFQSIGSVKNSLGNMVHNPKKKFYDAQGNRIWDNQPFSHRVLNTEVFRVEELVQDEWRRYEYN